MNIEKLFCLALTQASLLLFIQWGHRQYDDQPGEEHVRTLQGPGQASLRLNITRHHSGLGVQDVVCHSRHRCICPIPKIEMLIETDHCRVDHNIQTKQDRVVQHNTAQEPVGKHQDCCVWRTCTHATMRTLFIFIPAAIPLDQGLKLHRRTGTDLLNDVPVLGESLGEHGPFTDRF